MLVTYSDFSPIHSPTRSSSLRELPRAPFLVGEGSAPGCLVIGIVSTPHECFDPVSDIQFQVDIFNMEFNGIGGNEQALPNICVCTSLSQEIEDLAFAGRQSPLTINQGRIFGGRSIITLFSLLFHFFLTEQKMVQISIYPFQLQVLITHPEPGAYPDE